MGLLLTRDGLRAVQDPSVLDEFKTEILLLVHDRRNSTVPDIIDETNRGRDAIRDLRQLVQGGFLAVDRRGVVPTRVAPIPTSTTPTSTGVEATQ